MDDEDDNDDDDGKDGQDAEEEDDGVDNGNEEDEEDATLDVCSVMWSEGKQFSTFLSPAKVGKHHFHNSQDHHRDIKMVRMGMTMMMMMVSRRRSMIHKSTNQDINGTRKEH